MTPNTPTLSGKGPSPAGAPPPKPLEVAEAITRRLLREDSSHQVQIRELLNILLTEQNKPMEVGRGKPMR